MLSLVHYFFAIQVKNVIMYILLKHTFHMLYIVNSMHVVMHWGIISDLNRKE